MFFLVILLIKRTSINQKEQGSGLADNEGDPLLFQRLQQGSHCTTTLGASFQGSPRSTSRAGCGTRRCPTAATQLLWMRALWEVDAWFQIFGIFGTSGDRQWFIDHPWCKEKSMGLSWACHASSHFIHPFVKCSAILCGGKAWSFADCRVAEWLGQPTGDGTGEAFSRYCKCFQAFRMF